MVIEVRPRVLLALLVLFSLGLGIASAQTNETTTTSVTNTTTTVTTYTIIIANVTPTQRPNIQVRAYYTGPGSVNIIAMCNYISGVTCPNITITVGWNGTIFYNNTLSFTNCLLGVCKQLISLTNVTNTTWVYWEADGFHYNTTIHYVSPPAGPAAYIVSAIPLAIIAGLMFRGSIRLAGLGGIMGAIVVYLGNVVGLWNYNPLLVSLSVIVGVIMLWLS